MSQYVVDGGVVPRFAHLLVALAEATGTRLTEGRIRSYATALADVPWESLVAACAVARQECAFFPSIPEIRKHLGPSGDDAALMAWTGLCRAAEDAGAWYDVELEDGAARFALLSVFGSWPAFCEMSDGPGLALKRQEFLAAYRQGRREIAAPGPVSGRLEGLGARPDRGWSWTAAIGRGGAVDIRRTEALPPAREPGKIGDGS